MIPAMASMAFAIRASGNQTANAAPTDILDERLHAGATIEQYVAQVVAPLRSADRMGDGLDHGDVIFAKLRTAAQQRAGEIGRVLRYDLDGDLKVTREEIDQSQSNVLVMARRQSASESELSRYDKDGDGTITIQEAAANATRNRRSDYQLSGLLALDPNSDGQLTAKELRKLAERHFSTVDTDDDGKISPDEFAPIAQRKRTAMMERNLPVCNLPAVPKGAKLVVFGGYEGDAMSSAVIGGPDQETNLIDVNIESGSSPLYLILTSYESMVWRVNGDTKRIAQVVVSSAKSAQHGGSSLSGVEGLPRGKVTIADRQCPRPFYKTDGRSEVTALAPVTKALGRKPDAIFTGYSVKSISLPSGRPTKANVSETPLPRGFDPEMWQAAIRFWPGGLVTVKPGNVVSDAKVEAYKVLPSQMGLSQLIGQGAVEKTGSRTFRIVRPIPHLPPSMGGAHSVTFNLASDVPMPPGNPVHSCIRSEKTGQVVGNETICKR